MAIFFLDIASTTVVNSILKRTTSSDTPIHDIESSKDVSGIEIRMLPPLIKNNHTPRVWPFPGYAKLYCITIVVSDVANQLVGAIDLKGFSRMGDNEHLPINKTIFYWQSEKVKDKAPNQIHVFCSVLKSKQALRDISKILGDIKNDEGYKGLIGKLGKVAKKAAKFNLVTDIMVQLAEVVGKHLGNVEDKPVGTVINSHTTLHGDFDNIGITPLLYNTPDIDFKFEVVVRNKVVEAEAVKAVNGNGVETDIMIAAPKNNTEEKAEEVEVDMVAL